MRGFEVIAIGASYGGLRALEAVLAGLPAQVPAAVVVVQHLSKNCDDVSGILQKHTCLPVRQVEDKEAILPGHVYLAPPDYHLLVERGYFALSTDGPWLHARPSVDVLFESCASVYGRAAVGVILTGANRDGAQGLAAIKARGGLAIVQDPATAESRTMCDAAIAATQVDKILPLSAIGPFLAGLFRSDPVGRLGG